ncbi:mechanosensitive ion channel family protein [Halobacterium zhouii]|uniref:mechanosensitive ion channel family protein n=1 Tax=Halobacterium zhouii TaxID=2902624 RepID=UPI001E35DC36|nr:mechanosensitive ion channel family protein [Halobacterium zhouii]
MAQPSVDVAWNWLVANRGWLYAAVVLFGAWYAGNLLVRVFGRRIARRFQRPSVTRTVLRLVRTVTLFIGIFTAMGLIGVRITDIFISVTVFSAVLGLVLAPIVGSVVNGLFVLADQPYEIGDMVEFTQQGQRGFVEDITLRYTKIFTLDNTFLVIPNSVIRERDIINYSAEDERTRLSIDVGVTYESDVEEARKLVEDAATSVDGVIKSGPDIRIGSARFPSAPRCNIDQFGESSVDLRLRYWARDPYRLLKLRSNIQEAIWDRFRDTESVEIAYPHRHHVFDETSGDLSVRRESE